jgi:four helix bundle protein
LRDQIRRAAVSVLSNIAEGFERFHPGEFHQYLMISKSSCAEVRSQLFVALAAGYLDKSNFDRLRHLAEETSRIIGGLRAAIHRKKNANNS